MLNASLSESLVCEEVEDGRSEIVVVVVGIFGDADERRDGSEKIHALLEVEDVESI